MDAKQVEAQWERHDLFCSIDAREMLAKLGLFPPVTAADFPLQESKTAEDAREELQVLLDYLDVADLVALWGLARLLYKRKAKGYTYDFIAHFAPKYAEAVRC